MSKYTTVHTKSSPFEDNDQEHGFFERYFTQLRDINKTNLDFIMIWFQFCKINNIIPKKPWQISSNELKDLNRLPDHTIFLSLAQAIGSFWKDGYTGDGF